MEPQLPHLPQEKKSALDQIRSTAAARVAAEALARKRAEPEKLRKERERIDARKMLDEIREKENDCISFAEQFLKLVRAPKEKEVEKSIRSWAWIDMMYVKRRAAEDIARTPLIKLSKNNKKRQAHYAYVKDNTHREDNYRGTDIEGYPIEGYEWQEHDSYGVRVVLSSGLTQDELAALSGEEKSELEKLGETLDGTSITGFTVAEYIFGDTSRRDKIETVEDAQEYCNAVEEAHNLITFMRVCLENNRLNPKGKIDVSILFERSTPKIE